MEDRGSSTGDAVVVGGGAAAAGVVDGAGAEVLVDGDGVVGWPRGRGIWYLSKSCGGQKRFKLKPCTVIFFWTASSFTVLM